MSTIRSTHNQINFLHPFSIASANKSASPFQSTCKEKSDCLECYEHSIRCHWCEDDQKCHPRDSIHGCIHGMTCKIPSSISPSGPPVPTMKPTKKPPSPSKSSCSKQYSCPECYKYSIGCHWCEHDQACHPKGSIHGCVTGSTCAAPSISPSFISPTADLCMRHTSCNTCADNRLCHWCGHNQTCHAIGRVHGCADNTNCYADDQYKREVSERLDHSKFTQMTTNQILFTLTVELSIFCVVSLFFIFILGLKGCSKKNRRNTGTNFEGQIPSPAFHSTGSVINAIESELEGVVEDTDITAGNTEEVMLIRNKYDAVHDGSDANNNCIYERIQNEGASLSSSRESTVDSTREDSRMMNILDTFCKVMFTLTIICIVATTFGILLYFPHTPDYDICNDEDGWGNMFQKLSKKQVGSKYELLISIKNTNRFNIVLDEGSGEFKHNEIQAGTFYVPGPIYVNQTSINDVVVVLDLSQINKGELKSLISDYNAGELIVDVNSVFKLRFPILFNYSFEINSESTALNINDVDRKGICKQKADYVNLFL